MYVALGKVKWFTKPVHALHIHTQSELSEKLVKIISYKPTVGQKNPHMLYTLCTFFLTYSWSVHISTDQMIFDQLFWECVHVHVCIVQQKDTSDCYACHPLFQAAICNKQIQGSRVWVSFRPELLWYIYIPCTVTSPAKNNKLDSSNNEVCWMFFVFSEFQRDLHYKYFLFLK